jgi:3-oxoadipate enol-lactonase
MALAATNGGITSYAIDGDGPPLVLLHGFEGTQRSFADIAPLLRDDWTVITYDQREKGDTVFPDQSYAMADLADDLAALLDALEQERAHVVGWSFSGAIAQAFALRYPERLDHLALASATRKPALEAFPPDVQALVQRMSQGDPDASRVLHQRYFDPRSLARDPGLVKTVLDRRAAHTPEQLSRRLGALANFDMRGRLGGVQAPTLVFQGRADPISLPEESLELALELEATLVILDGVGHFWPVEAPARSAALLTAFLQERL